MATNKENLQLAYDRTCQALADLSLNPRPNYSIDGRSYSWQSLFDSLLKRQESLLMAMQKDDGPFEIVSWPPGA